MAAVPGEPGRSSETERVTQEVELPFSSSASVTGERIRDKIAASKKRACGWAAIRRSVIARASGRSSYGRLGHRLHLAFGVKAIQRIGEFYVDPATALVIKHDDGRRPVDGDFRNVPTVGEIIAQAQFASGRKGESGFAIRCPDDASPTAFCIRVVVVKSLRSQ